MSVHMTTHRTPHGIAAGWRWPIIGLALLGLLISLSVTAVKVDSASAQVGVRRAYGLEVNKGRLIRLPNPAKVVFIANPRIADIQVKSPTLVYLFAKRVGETTLIAVDGEEKVLINALVSVNHNLSRLRRAMRAVLPKRRIRIRSVDGSIVLAGKVDSPAEATKAVELANRVAGDARRVVNQLKVIGPNQVNLRVRVVEMSRTAMRQLGINWDALMQRGAWILQAATGLATTASGAFPPATPFALRRTINQRTSNSLGLNYSSGPYSVNAVIDALETEGLIKVLAEPNLTALTGKAASFLAGGEFPIPVPQDGGAIGIEFKKFGVELAFVPVIHNGNRISLRVRTEVSQLSTAGAITIQGTSIPALTTRRAETSVDVSSGQSFAIAGLLQNNVTKDLSKVPWLGDVPVVGRLFQSEQFQRNETELVIIVTPYVVRPGMRKKLAQARSRAAHTDIKRIVLGRKKGRRVTSPKRLVGPAGFILE